MDVARLDRCHVCECGGGGEAGRGEALQGEIEENLESEVGFSSGGSRGVTAPPLRVVLLVSLKVPPT